MPTTVRDPMSPNESRQTRSQQREAAREKAKSLREASARKERNKKVALISIIVVVLLAVVAIIAGAAVNSNKPAASPLNLNYDNGIKIGTNLEAFTSTNTPKPAPTAAGKAIPNIVIYVDYQCPICQAFEAANGEQIKQWVNSGIATVEYHPISFLDGRASPNAYSSRAANAAICVATHSPNQYFAFTQLLFQNQPAENTPGPENSALVETAKQAGVSNADKIADCINNKTYGKWLASNTNKVLSADYTVKGTDIPVKGTPTVVVNGVQLNATVAQLADPAFFAAWFQQVTK